MQHISDNEFDRLFKDNLAEAEVSPSASLWARVEPQISPKKRNRLPYLWMAAASVVVALSAGLLFMQTDQQQNGAIDTAKLNSSVERKSKSVKPEVAYTSENGSSAIEPGETVNDAATLAMKSIEKNRSTAINEDKSDESPMVKNEKSLIAMQPVLSESHLTITTPGQESEQTLGAAIATPDMETALVSAEMPSATYPNEVANVEQPEKARIRNAGDLVNFVVDKIDKREQKILEFKTDDDDNSSLIAINIGPFKLNQRKHK